MKKSIISIIAGISAAALMLTACTAANTAQQSAQPSQSTQPSQPAVQAENDGVTLPVMDMAKPEGATIKVAASEAVKVDPDMASVSLAVISIEDTVDKVTKANSEAVNAVIQYFKDAGYEDRSISTTNVSLYPTYDYSGAAEKITGYRMYTNIEVTDIKKDDVGAALSGAIGAGANSIDSIRYYASSYDEAYNDALDLAIKSAGEKAAVIAKSSGGELGACVSIEEYTPDTSERYSNTYGNVEAKAVEDASAAGAMESLAFMPSQIDVNARITVTYELAR